LVVLAAGFGIFTMMDASSPLWMVLVGAGLVAAGVLTTTTLTSDRILASAPPERAGSASATSETATELGGALGMAILGTVGAAVYSSQMTDAVVGLPPEAATTAADTLPGALAVAPQLTEAARDAFTSGFTTTAVVGVVLALGTAVFGYFTLRGIPAPVGSAKEEKVAA
jgi:DHA2 family multidrug resistance protein-like MFS transporter